ncbi:MAG: NADPH-dependent glutamate synthase [Candidatus Cloacimonadota bacterium]|nr:NADPH-dependent glutamate synthase [Candidatus Cloacimonadota bacterium]
MAIQRRVPMREQAPEERIKNFKSVPLGYSKEEAITEAKRCIQCKNPTCEPGCPVRMDIKDIIYEIAHENFEKAFLISKKDNAVPAMTGRVCPQEEQCEGVCILGKKGDPINIGKLFAFVADWARENGITEHLEIKESAKKVAIVGAGPAGITCAVDLRKMGYQVTIFEALHMAGGVLQYGIPPFRLPRDVVDYELAFLEEIGVDIQLNHIVGQNVDFSELRENYDAIYLATGAGAPKFLKIDGEKLKGVYSANEFLIRVNLMKAYKFPDWDTPIIYGDKVGVIGCGNVALDSARCAKRLGAKEVFILYRRTKACAPAREEEILHAMEEGIIFKEMVCPSRIIGNDDGWITGIGLIKTKFEGIDKAGRPRPVNIKNSEMEMDLDTLIIALGTTPNRLFLSNAPELDTYSWGGIKTDDSFETNLKGVFAGGDALTGGSTVIAAMGNGRDAAVAIQKSLNE